MRHAIVTGETGISIHVPREGDDQLIAKYDSRAQEFQSTSPVRGTTANTDEELAEKIFQSTSPVRGTTPQFVNAKQGSTHFNPRPP